MPGADDDSRRGPAVRAATPDDREPDLNADLALPAFADTAAMAWQGSPAEGVLRKRLELAGEDAPRLTTVVRFAPGSAFPAHVHDGGEEFLVLAGAFVDERGAYPAGSYVRNPAGTRHSPSSPEGCDLLVKLRQFAPGDDDAVVVRTGEAPWVDGPAQGVALQALHAFGRERVFLARMAAGARWSPDGTGGLEAFVLQGALSDASGGHGTGTWLRFPPGATVTFSAAAGCRLYLKTGHLAPG